MASHWPCATDTMFYPPMGSMGKDREMSTHAYVPSGCGTIYRFFTLQFGTSISWEGNCMASHWPCATDTMFYPPMGSMGKDREMSTHAYVPSGCGTIYRFFYLTIIFSL